MKKTSTRGGQSVRINDTTLRASQPATTIYGFSPIKNVVSHEVTREEIKAITKDGTDIIYSALVHVALSRGIWILKEGA